MDKILTDTRVRVALNFDNLTEVFKSHLDWNAARRKCFAMLVLGVIHLQTVNLVLLSMDREFVGKRWLAWLDKQGIGYVVRIKRNTVFGAVNEL